MHNYVELKLLHIIPKKLFQNFALSMDLGTMYAQYERVLLRPREQDVSSWSRRRAAPCAAFHGVASTAHSAYQSSYK